MYQLGIKPRAILMVKDEYKWYEKQKQVLGEEFLEELDKFYHKVQSHPEYFGRVKKELPAGGLKKGSLML